MKFSYKIINYIFFFVIILPLSLAVCTDTEQSSMITCMGSLNSTVGLQDTHTMCTKINSWGQCIPKCACEDKFVEWVGQNFENAVSVYRCDTGLTWTCSAANIGRCGYILTTSLIFLNLWHFYDI